MSNPPLSTNNDSANASVRRQRKWLIYGLFGLLIALALLVALAPTMLSTPIGRSALVGVINDNVRGSVTIDALSLSWLGGQRVRGVEILDPSGATVARLEEASTELTLLGAIQRKLSLGRTTIRGLTADLMVDESGTNNLTRALEPKQPATSDATPLAVPFTGNVELSDARMTVTTPRAVPAVFDGMAGTMRIEPAQRVLNVGLQGNSRQGDSTGQFTITGQVADLIAPDGTLSLHTAKGDLEANVKDLPIDSVDGMLGLQGLLSAAAGDTANLKLQLSGTAQVQNLVVTADSANIQGVITAEIKQDRFALTQPATVQLNVTPDLFRTLYDTAQADATLRLVKAFPLHFKAEKLEMPISDFSLAGVAIRGDGVIQKPIQLAGAHELEQVTIRSLTATVDSERLADKVGIKLDGEAVSLNKPGQIEVQATIDQMINEQGSLQLDKMRADVSANLSNLPTLLIDQIARQNGQLVNLLGPKIDLSAQAKSSGPDQIDATVTVDAGPLKATEVTLALTDSVALTKPAQISYLLSPQVLQQMLGEDAGLNLQQPTELVLEIQAFSAPRPKAGEPMFQPTETALNGSLSSGRLVFSGIADFDALQAEAVRLDLTADSLASIRLQGSAQVSEAGRGILAELSTSPLQVRLDTETSLDAAGQLGPIGTQIKLAGDGVNGEMNVSITPDFSRATLTAPGSLQLVLTPGLLQQLGAAAPNAATLAKPTPVQISLSQLDLPLAVFSLSATQAEAALRFDELTLAGDQSVAGAALRNADVSVAYDGPNGSAKVKLAAETVPAGGQQSGTLHVDAKLNRLLRDGELSLSTADVDATAKIDALPTAVLAALSGQAALVPIVGDVIKVDASVDQAGDQGVGAIELKAQSPNLSADAGFKLGDELILSRPASMRLTLTPAGFAAVMDDSSQQDGPAYELSEDAIFEAAITQLQWPLAAADGTTPFNPSRAAVVATATTPRLSLRDRGSGRTFTIEMFEMMLQGSDLSKPLNIELNGQIRDAHSDGGQSGDQAGRIGISGQASDVFTKEGQFNSEGLSLNLDGQLQKLPTALLDQLFDVDGMMVATLGDTTDVTVNTNVRQMVGPLNLALRSGNATADVKAQLQSEGLVLTEPLLAEVQVTQAFGKFVLGKIHPIFETAQSSERAVRFEVAREGVLIPIKDYDLSRVVIPQMALDLGQLTLKSGWLLKGAVGLAQQFGALEGSGREQWTAQFTPAILRMTGGKVTYDRRLDMLLDERMHLATWGTADVANDRAELILAFMPETLEKVFGLTVAAGDALRIQLRGALSEPSVDFAKAGLEIERLRQQQRLAKKNQLVGALVGAVATTAIGGAPIPPPSVDPLPWGPLPVPEGQVEAAPAQSEEPAQPAQPAAPKSLEEQAIEGLMGILKKKKKE